jgi:hypothetical protein
MSCDWPLLVLLICLLSSHLPEQLLFFIILQATPNETVEKHPYDYLLHRKISYQYILTNPSKSLKIAG